MKPTSFLWIALFSLSAYAGAGHAPSAEPLLGPNAATFSQAKCRVQLGWEDRIVVMARNVSLIAQDSDGAEVIAHIHADATRDASSPHNDRQLRLWGERALNRARALGYCQ